MTEWKAKRFYSDAAVFEAEDGFGITLDDRPLNTPFKSALHVPSRQMAEAIAEEWRAQQGEIAPLSMPVTRSANSAIDKVLVQKTAVADMLAAYGETDLLCYRAESPEALVARQAEHWDPILRWAEHRLDAPLRVTQGVLPIDQPADSLATLGARVHDHDHFELTALHDLVGLSGSLVLGLWTSDDVSRVDDAWQLSRLDEEWQIEQWGADEDATMVAAGRRADFLHAARFLSLSRA